MFKNLKMRNKLLVTVLTVSTIIFIIATVINFTVVNANIKELAEKEAVQIAYHQSSIIETDLEKAGNTAITIAQMFAQYSDLNGYDRRKGFISMLKSVILESPKFYSIWSVWEPNTIDNLDSKFINTPGCNESGRFSPVWTRENDNIDLKAISENNLANLSNLIEAKESKHRIIENPAKYLSAGGAANAGLKSSIVEPIIVNGRYVGAVGIDFTLDSFQNMIEMIKPYGNGYAYIVANNGIIAAHPKKDLIGMNIVITEPENNKKYKILQNIMDGLEFKFIQKSENNGSDAEVIFVPVKIDYTETPWAFAIEIPLNTILEKSRNLLLIFITLIVMSSAVLALMMFFVARQLLRPIISVSNTLSDIAKGEGDLTKRILFDSKDEIGILAQNFNLFISNLNNDMLQVEKAAVKIKASSDRSNEIIEGSTKNADEIKKSINGIDIQTENATSGIEELTATLEEMSRNIDNIMNNMVRQASAVEEGASSIEEMVRTIENTTEMSKKTNDISNNLNKVANEGGIAVKNSIQSIKEVSEYSQQILKLLGLISNIAKQTNLLAMNAAIEAAHAGEAGKGFAIVADEIRRLSEDTNKNAKDIGEVVGSIVSRIDESVKLAEKAGIGLDLITAYSQQNVQIISQLSISMAEQNNGAKEILKSTQEMVKITEEVKISMIEQKNATDDFSGALVELRDLSLQNKENVKKHLDNLTSLMSFLDEIKKIFIENQNQANQLHGFVDKFVLENKGEEKTGLKLVE